MDVDDLTGGSRKRKAAAVEKDLPLSLEELYSGCTKRLKVSPQGGGAAEVLSITVPGKGGTIPGAPSIPRDLAFVVKEKPHPVFTRDGNNLAARVHVPLVKALCGGAIQVRAITGEQLSVNVPEGMDAETVITVPRQGMPDQKGGQRGDLRLQLLLQLPRLTAQQKASMRTLLQ